MKAITRLSSIVLALGLCAAAQIAAAAPASFAYQGVILEQNGLVPATKNRTVEFRIYDGPTSANVLWGRTYNVLLDANGLFNAPLSDATGSPIAGVTGTGLTKILADNAERALYVGLTVDGSSGEISPRQAILAVPYAMHAADAAKASGNFPVEGKVTAAGLEVSGSAKLMGVSAFNLSAVGGNVSVAAPGEFVGYGTTPKGGIILWSGSASAIPDGWALCNGANGTPDLRGRFVVGFDPGDADYNNPGNRGGEKRHTLGEGEMPKHTHQYVADDSAQSADSIAKQVRWTEKAYDCLSVNDNGSSQRVYKTTETGGGGAHENRPPYYTLCYIMRVK